MSEKLITIAKQAQTEILVKKSRFIASAAPVESDEAGMEFINQIKKDHSQANHNVYAYVINEQTQRYSDDGEPGGTAGKPVLDVIKHKGLSGVALVVTRYFGGVLLGAGGLVRAYTEAAVAGIESAGVVERVRYQELEITMDYHWLGIVKHELEKNGGRQISIQYEQQISLKVYLPPEIAELVARVLIDRTAAQIMITKGKQVYL